MLLLDGVVEIVDFHDAVPTTGLPWRTIEGDVHFTCLLTHSYRVERLRTMTHDGGRELGPA